MLLQIEDPQSNDLSDSLREAIERDLPGADVAVRIGSPRHYEISVTAAEFQGLNKVKQHQRVYAAIGPFMRGDDAPVHAIDRLDTRVP